MSIDLSPTSIVNRSLGFLGERLITSFDNPQTPSGKLMVNNYPMVRRETLYVFPWPFAETWATLNLTNPPPPGPTIAGVTPTPIGYNNAYALPADFIRLVDFDDPVHGKGRVEGYRFITQNGQRCIATDATNQASATPPLQFSCAYIADVEELNLWSIGALEVFAWGLAKDVAKSITGQDKLAQFANEQYNLALQNAAGIEGSMQPKLRQPFSNVARDRERVFLGDVSFFTPVIGYPNT